VGYDLTKKVIGVDLDGELSPSLLLNHNSVISEKLNEFAPEFRIRTRDYFLPQIIEVIVSQKSSTEYFNQNLFLRIHCLVGIQCCPNVCEHCRFGWVIDLKLNVLYGSKAEGNL
jgi:hypothetical protein